VVAYGHLEVLKYAHKRGYPWDTSTCHIAAKYGHLDILTYSHENGCKLDKEILPGNSYFGDKAWQTKPKQPCSKQQNHPLDPDWATPMMTPHPLPPFPPHLFYLLASPQLVKVALVPSR
jgi:hypothetical protein